MNPRSKVAISAALAVISVVVTAALWKQLRTERATGMALQARQSTPANQEQMPPAAVSHEQPDALVTTAALPATPEAKPHAASVATPLATPGSPAAQSRVIRINEQDLLKDPEYRKARVAMIRSNLMQSYPGLAAELRLSTEEADRFFDQLAENQMALTSHSSLFTTELRKDPAVEEEFVRKLQALQRQGADSLRLILGNSRYSTWMDYQQTRSLRLRTSDYAIVLAQAGSPLDSAQLGNLTTAALEEQKNLQRDILELGRTVDVANPQSQVRAQEALQRRQSESNQRVLDAVAPNLTAQQLNLLRAEIEQRTAVERSIAEVRRRTRELQPQP